MWFGIGQMCLKKKYNQISMCLIIMHAVYVAGVSQLLDNTMMVLLYHGFK